MDEQNLNSSVDEAIAPLEGHPTEEFEPAPVHPVHALVLEAHAALKRGVEALDRRGIPVNTDDVRLAFRALDAVLAEVQKHS